MTDDGPAFPQALSMEEDYPGSSGMSLRDWFAGQALAGVLANLSQMDKVARNDIARQARDCYLMADAMLKAREPE